MEQVFEFIGNHPILTGAFGLVLGILIVTEVSRMTRRWKELETLDAVRLINREEALVIDVSNSTDHAKGHIAGALHMPPSRIEAGNKQLLKSRERPVLLYCRNGQVSPQMANRLVKLGFEQVHVLRGGLTQWVSDNQPVTRQKAARKSGEGKRKGKNKTQAVKGDQQASSGQEKEKAES